MSILNPYPNIADRKINDVTTWSSAKIINELQPALNTEITLEETYEGNIVTFNNLTNKEITSLECEILPIQEGTGTPSPSNPRPISGTSVLNVTRAGKNIFDISQFASLYPQYCTYENDVLNVQGQTILYTKGIEAKAPAGAKLSATITDISSVNARFRLYYTDGTYSDVYPNQLPFSLLKDLASVRLNWSTNGAFKIENAQIEIGSTATTYAPYTTTTTPAPLARTIYGGSAEAIGGTGEETHGYIASYNGEAINEPWLSSIDPYVQGTTPSIGAEVVYPLTTPEPFTFEGVTVECLEGINNIWTDTGDIKVTTGETDTIGNILKERGILP